MIPDRWVEYYLGNAPSLVWLVGTNLLAVLVGLRFYLDTPPGLASIPTFLIPLYTDSPVAVLLAALSVATLLPNLGRRVADAPRNVPLAYLHTLAFVWLVKYGVWTAIALNVRPELYFGVTGGAIWDYWGIIVTHLAFVLEAAVIPYYGVTTRGALAFALVALLANDAVDYVWGYYPPLEYDPFGTVLPAVTVALSFIAVFAAARAFDRYDPERARTGA